MSITDVQAQLALLADRLPIPAVTRRIHDTTAAADRLATTLRGTDDPEVARAPGDVHAANTLVSGAIERMVAAQELITAFVVRL